MKMNVRVVMPVAISIAKGPVLVFVSKSGINEVYYLSIQIIIWADPTINSRI